MPLPSCQGVLCEGAYHGRKGEAVDDEKFWLALERKMTMTDTIEGSNSLPELAARIRAFHESTIEGLRQSVENGMAAGDLLIEAKAQLKHGHWLPWLRDNCNISERTAQLYMRLAKNRAAIEEQAKSATVADLNLNEAAALLMLSSDARKLLEMVKTMEGLDGEELVKFCLDNNVELMTGNIFGAPEPTAQEWIEWRLFMLWLRRTCGFTVTGAEMHTDWIQSRGTLLKDWMRPHPMLDAWREPIPQKTFDAWNAFLEANRGRSLDDVTAELDALKLEDARWREQQANKKGRKARRAQAR
jgi:hypothetical protein